MKRRPRSTRPRLIRQTIVPAVLLVFLTMGAALAALQVTIPFVLERLP
jgi:hypothetical protein